MEQYGDLKHKTRKVKHETSIVFAIVGFLVFVYLLFGGAIFHALEHNSEKKAIEEFHKKTKQLKQALNLSEQNITQLFKLYETYRPKLTRGPKAELLHDHHIWDFGGALHFAGTVITTIGFGALSPVSNVARVLLIFYALFGCSLVVLFFNLFMDRFIFVMTLIMKWYKRRKIRKKNRDDEFFKKYDENQIETSKPSPLQVIITLSVVTAAMMLASAGIYKVVEDWSFVDSLYFCFIAFSTIGFGDYVSGQQPYDPNISVFYKISNGVIIAIGCCCFYAMFNVIAIFINKFIKISLFKFHLYKNKLQQKKTAVHESNYKAESMEMNMNIIPSIKEDGNANESEINVFHEPKIDLEDEGTTLSDLQNLEEFKPIKYDSNISLGGPNNGKNKLRATLSGPVFCGATRFKKPVKSKTISHRVVPSDESVSSQIETSWSEENNVGPMSVLQHNLNDV